MGKRKSMSTESPADEEPQSPPKTLKKPKKYASKEEEVEPVIESEEEKPKKSTSKSKEKTAVLTDEEGGQYVELGKKKRVTVRQFKGTTLIDIREFYGEPEKPGKKGISLTVDQWNALKDCADSVDELISSQPKKSK